MTTRSAAKQRELQVALTRVDAPTTDQEDQDFTDNNLTDEGEILTDLEYRTDDDGTAYDSEAGLRRTRGRSRTQTLRSNVTASNSARTPTRPHDSEEVREVLPQPQDQQPRSSQAEARDPPTVPKSAYNSTVHPAVSGAGDSPARMQGLHQTDNPISRADLAEILRHMRPQDPEAREPVGNVTDSEVEQGRRRPNHVTINRRVEVAHSSDEAVLRTAHRNTSRSSRDAPSDSEDVMNAHVAALRKMTRMEAELRRLRREKARQANYTRTDDSDTCYESARESPAQERHPRRRAQGPSPPVGRSQEDLQYGEVYRSRASPRPTEIKRQREHAPSRGKPHFTNARRSGSVYDYSSGENSDASIDRAPRPSKSQCQLPIRAFDGKNWAGFKSQFEITCRLNAYSEEEKAGRLVNALSGDALTVLPKGRTCPTYKQLMERLDEKYCSLRSDTDILNRLSEVTRQQGESCYVFAERIKQIADSADMSPEELPQVLFTTFHAGLKHYRDTQVAITKAYPKRRDWTLENAVRVATGYEMIHGQRVTSTNDNINWGTIASAQPAEQEDSITINAVAPHGERTPLFERVLKIEKETGALNKMVEMFKEETAATRRSIREINDNLIQLKTRYEESENRRLHYRDYRGSPQKPNRDQSEPREQRDENNNNRNEEPFRFGNGRRRGTRFQRNTTYNNRSASTEPAERSSIQA